MLPFVTLGAALWYLSRLQRNPDWITVNGKHLPLRHGDGRAGDATPYDGARVGETGTAKAASRTLQGNFTLGQLPALVRTLDVRNLALVDEERRKSLGNTIDALRELVAKAPNNAPDATDEQRAKLAAALPRWEAGWNKLVAVNEAKFWATGYPRTSFDLTTLVKSGGVNVPTPVADYSATYKILYGLEYAKPWNKDSYTRLYLTDGIAGAAKRADVSLDRNLREANVYWDDEAQGFGWKMRTSAALPVESDRTAVTAQMLVEARAL